MRVDIPGSISLAGAVNSLGDKTPDRQEDGYLGWAAASVNRMTEGYLLLRCRHRVGASKLLIRPVLESTFHALVVVRKEGFFFRKAYSEWREETERKAMDRQLERLEEALRRDASSMRNNANKASGGFLARIRGNMGLTLAYGSEPSFGI